MPCCPCPISKSNQKIFTLIDKREAVTSTVDGTCTSMIWTAFVRNRETNINSAVVGVIIVFTFYGFFWLLCWEKTSASLLRFHLDKDLLRSLIQRKVGYKSFQISQVLIPTKSGVCSAPLPRLSMQTKMAFLGNHCQAMALARLIQSGAFIDSKSCFA